MEHKKLKAFPNDFLWGSASAAYQVEGAPLKMAKKPVSGIILSVFQARLLKERMGMSLLIIIIAIKKMWL